MADPTVRRTAVVTGATSGIGAAFARQLAALGYDLILVARRDDRLRQAAVDLSSAYGTTVRVVVADLSTEEGRHAVEVYLTDRDDPIHLLVNNAGGTLKRSFLRTDPGEEERLLQLNVHAVMRLTHAALPGMVDRGVGGVINVSSVSGFAPVMPGSTYPATKAWVTNFSQSIAAAVRPSGVRVMALCPGYTRTEFHEGINMSKTPSFMWLEADDVVGVGLRDFARGKVVSIPDWRYKIAAFGLRHAPRGLLGRTARDTRGRATEPVTSSPEESGPEIGARTAGTNDNQSTGIGRAG